jgi:hypothetical protein
MEHPQINFSFNCMNIKYYTGTIDDFGGDYEYQYYFSIGYKDNKFYFPYIHYHEFYTEKQEIYHNIDIEYENYKDIYDFINVLYDLFRKDFIYTTEVGYTRSVRPINWKKSIQEKILSCRIEIIDFTLDNLTYYLEDIKNTDLKIKAAGFDRSYYQVELETTNETDVLKKKYLKLNKWLI